MPGHARTASAASAVHHTEPSETPEGSLFLDDLHERAPVRAPVRLSLIALAECSKHARVMNVHADADSASDDLPACGRAVHDHADHHRACTLLPH